MTILRIIILILLFVLGRRIYRNLKAASRSAGSSRPEGRGTPPGSGRTDPGMKDLTDQDISDADFEEIP